MPHQDHAALRDALLTEADRHTPDTAAMLARIERGMAAAPARRRGRLFSRGRRAASGHGGFRIAGTAVAISAVLGLSVAATWAAVGAGSSPDTVRTTEPAGSGPEIGSATSSPRPSSPSARATGSAPAGGRGTTASPSQSPGGATSQTASGEPTGGATQAQQGFLWSDGSVDPHSGVNWAQSNVTVKNHGTAVTALDVRLWVVLTPGVSYAGEFTTLPTQDVTVTVTQQGDALLYEWRLKPGVTVAPGSYEFAGQYGHAMGGRDAGQDRYDATATGADGTREHVYGDFYATH
jgi:hypothetical protein